MFTIILWFGNVTILESSVRHYTDVTPASIARIKRMIQSSYNWQVLHTSPKSPVKVYRVQL